MYKYPYVVQVFKNFYFLNCVIIVVGPQKCNSSRRISFMVLSKTKQIKRPQKNIFVDNKLRRHGFFVLWYSAAESNILTLSCTQVIIIFLFLVGLKTRGRKFDTRRHSSRRPYRDAVDGASRHPSCGFRLRQITEYLTVDLTYDGWIGGHLTEWIIGDGL